MPNYRISGEINAWLGEVSKVRATVHANSTDGGYIADADEVILGGGLIPVASDGTFSVSLPSTADTDLQYEVRAEYVDNATRQRQTWRSGWNTLTANVGIGDFAETGSLLVSPSLAAQLAARIDGGTDHGDQSGTLTLDAAEGTHALDATGPLTITLDPDAPDFRIITLYVASGASDVTVDGVDATLTDGGFATFVRIRGVWVLAAAGGEAGPTDETPPSAVTDLAASDGEGETVLTWSAATDSESTVHYRYRVWLTSGGATGTWTTTNLTTATVTGLSAGAYTAEVYSYSNGGSTTPDTDTATVTAPPGYNYFDEHTFTAANGTAVSTLPTAEGQTLLGAATAAVFDNSFAAAYASGGSGDASGPTRINVGTYPKAKANVTYDLSASGGSPGRAGNLTVEWSLDATSAIAFSLGANSWDSPSSVQISGATAYSSGVDGNEPPIVYESGKTSTLPTAAVLTVEADTTTSLCNLYVDGVLWAHVDTTAFNYSGTPNTVATDQFSWATGWNAKVLNLEIEVYT